MLNYLTLNKHGLNIIAYKGYLTNDINKTILPQKLLTNGWSGRGDVVAKIWMDRPAAHPLGNMWISFDLNDKLRGIHLTQVQDCGTLL